MAGSLLPGEQNPPPGHMAEAAAFLFEAAAQREPGEPSILIRTAHEGRRFMRVAVVNDDMPFLVDSVAMAIAAQGLAIDLLVHPIVAAARNAEGELLALPDAEDAAPRESMIYLETARVDAKDRRALERAIAAALGDVRAAVQDWAKMRGLMAADAEQIDDAEGAELLHWLGGGMLTQLGHVTRFRDGSRSQLLGICRKSARELLADDTYERAFAWFDRQAGERAGRAPLIIKANRLSKVHRRVPLDLFIVPIVDAGKVTALSIHAGVWTSTALLTPPDEVPVLRRQLTAMMELFDFPPASHDGKALLHALTTLPHDLVIGFGDRDIARVATAMMALGDRPRPRAALVMAPLARHLFAFVWLPRDMLSTQVRMQIQHMLEDETEADTLDWSLVVEGGNLAMLRYVLDFRGHEHSPDETTIDDRLQHMLRGWSEAVEAELEGYESGRAAALVARFAEGFPQGYRTTYGPAEAARDIARIHHLTPGDADRPLGRDARLYRIESDDPCKLGLKIYQLGPSMPLSDAVPALENFGFRVLSEVPTELGNGERYTIHDFRLLLPRREEVEAVFERESAIEAAIGAVLNGIAEDDVFNRLVIATGLDEREAGWMRALYRYLRQSAIAYTIYTVVDAMRGAPAVTRGLVELFRAHHDPGFKGDRAGTIAAADAAIRSGLAGVASINHDRLLRLVWRTIAAILRTNAFAPAAREALAFKFDSALVPGLPKPVPWREIWVYSRRVEGIHLRAGPVARGGLRWSDRRDDFRTEILGLMKAQRVKNAVIVPTGAKGGFYPKQLPDPADDRDAWFAEGRASYEVFIRTLLSVTDNLEGKKVVHPQCVVVRDGDDPYFVVAADKGTATFSDVANAIAIRTRLLARRRLRQRRVEGLRPQGDGHYRTRRLDLGAAALSGDGRRRADRPDPGRRLRRHVGRRVRQRHAAVEDDRTRRRVRPSPHLHRPRPRSGGKLGGAQAPVRAAAVELGRLRRKAHQQGRRGLRAQRQDHHHQQGSGRRARHRDPRVRSREPDQRHSQEPRRPPLVRRYRHLCPRRWRKRSAGRATRATTVCARLRAKCAPRSSARARTSASPRLGASPSR